MPFVSKAQRRWMFANFPEMARRWARHTGKKKLPERVHNATRNPLRLDPSRTTLLRKQFMAEVVERFTLLWKDLRDLIVKEDAFGLKEVSHDVHSVFVIHGGPGSGNFGHAGRPGEVGGSGKASEVADIQMGGSVATVYKNPTGDQVARLVKQFKYPKGMILKGDVYLWDSYEHENADAISHDAVAYHLGLTDFVLFDSKFYFKPNDKGVNVYTMDDPGKAPPEIKEWAEKNGFLINSEFASTQFNVKDEDVVWAVQTIQESISPDDVLELEEEPHVTVRYGLHNYKNMADRVEEISKGYGPVSIQFGKLSLFQNEEQDVLKVEVISEQLEELNGLLAELPHTQTHANYVPHLTIAYLKPGAGKKYLGLANPLNGSEIEVSSLTYSDKERNQEQIALNYLVVHGGKGSGNFGHKGRPGEVGGSSDSRDHTIQIRGRDVMISQNPSKSQMENWLRSSIKETGRFSLRLKGLLNGNDLYVWEDEEANHYPVARQLGFEIEPGDRFYLGLQDGGELFLEFYEMEDSVKQWADRNDITVNTRFRFHSDPDKVEAFRHWLAGRVKTHILLTDAATAQDAWWEKYIYDAYQKGARRGVAEVVGGTVMSSPPDTVTLKRVKMLAGRTFNDLKGITDAMSQQITRELVDGFIQDKTPDAIANAISSKVKSIGVERAKTLARTEIVRAQAEGQLDSMERLGVTHVNVDVEWQIYDETACPKCKALDGIVLTIKEARGLIPRHANCRCSWKAVLASTVLPGQVRSKRDVQRAIDRSVRAEIPRRTKRSVATQKKLSGWQGAGKTVKKRLRKSRKGDTYGLREILGNQLVVHGGEGSGNFGHKGRPGEVGGSSSGGLSWAAGGVDKYVATYQRTTLTGKVSENGSWVRVPSEFKTFNYSDLGIDAQVSREAFDKSPIRKVEINKLTLPQDVVKISNIKGPGPSEIVDVVDHGGKLYLWDGTHRVFRQAFAGKSTVDARVLTIKKSTSHDDTIIKAMHSVEIHAAKGALVSAKALRKATGLDKETFDKTLIEMQKKGMVSMHRHDYVSSLSDEDRNNLIHDPTAEHYGHSGTKYKGTYYVGAAIRQTNNEWADIGIVVHGGTGSGNFGHRGRPGQVGGSSEGGVEVEHFLGPVGKHTPAGQKRLIEYLEKETGRKFKPHGSVGKGKTSTNDIDLSIVPYTEEELQKLSDESHEEEMRMLEKVSKGEMTLADVYGDPNEEYKDEIDIAIEKLGFTKTKIKSWLGIDVHEYKNEKTRHTIEIWQPGEAGYDDMGTTVINTLRQRPITNYF